MWSDGSAKRRHASSISFISSRGFSDSIFMGMIARVLDGGPLVGLAAIIT